MVNPSKGHIINREEQLLSKLRRGDYDAYHQLYEAYAPSIMARLRRLVFDIEAAEELHQEVFLQIWIDRARLPVDISFKAILLHRAKIQAYKYYHKSAQDAKLREHLLATATELYSDLEDRLAYKETNTLLMAAVEGLPEQRRKIFVRIKFDGRSYEETATEFGVSLSTVKDHMTRALRYLRKQMTNEKPSTLFYLLLAALFE